MQITQELQNGVSSYWFILLGIAVGNVVVLVGCLSGFKTLCKSKVSPDTTEKMANSGDNGGNYKSTGSNIHNNSFKTTGNTATVTTATQHGTKKKKKKPQFSEASRKRSYLADFLGFFTRNAASSNAHLFAVVKWRRPRFHDNLHTVVSLLCFENYAKIKLTIDDSYNIVTKRGKFKQAQLKFFGEKNECDDLARKLNESTANSIIETTINEIADTSVSTRLKSPYLLQIEREINFEKIESFENELDLSKARKLSTPIERERPKQIQLKEHITKAILEVDPAAPVNETTSVHGFESEHSVHYYSVYKPKALMNEKSFTEIERLNSKTTDSLGNSGKSNKNLEIVVLTNEANSIV